MATDDLSSLNSLEKITAQEGHAPSHITHNRPHTMDNTQCVLSMPHTHTHCTLTHLTHHTHSTHTHPHSTHALPHITHTHTSLTPSHITLTTYPERSSPTPPPLSPCSTGLSLSLHPQSDRTLRLGAHFAVTSSPVAQQQQAERCEPPHGYAAQPHRVADEERDDGGCGRSIDTIRYVRYSIYGRREV